MNILADEGHSHPNYHRHQGHRPWHEAHQRHCRETTSCPIQNHLPSLEKALPYPARSSLRVSHQEAAWPLLKTGEPTAVAMVTQTQRACLNFCGAPAITPATLLSAGLKIRMLPSSAILANLDTVRFVFSPRGCLRGNPRFLFRRLRERATRLHDPKHICSHVSQNPGVQNPTWESL